MASDEPLNVTLKSGRIAGAIRTESGKLLVTKGDAVLSTAPLEEVEAVRDDAAQKAWDRERERVENPPLLDFWSGNISLNLATASGNAKTVTFGTGALAQRTTGADKIVLNYTSTRARARSSLSARRRTASAAARATTGT